MSDIFISYSRADVEVAKRLARALEKCGWSVFWDSHIPAGRQFSKVIESEMASAACVVTLWSKASIESFWVRDEADEALKREILAPVLIEPIRPPMGYRQVHAANLIDWRGDETHPGLVSLIRDITSLAGAPSRTTSLTDGFKSTDKERASKRNANRAPAHSSKQAIQEPSRSPNRSSSRSGYSSKKPVSAGDRKERPSRSKSPTLTKTDSETASQSLRGIFRGWMVLPVAGVGIVALAVFGLRGMSDPVSGPVQSEGPAAKADMVNLRVLGNDPAKPWNVLINGEDKGLTKASSPLVIPVQLGTAPTVECRRGNVNYFPPIAPVTKNMRIYCKPPR